MKTRPICSAVLIALLTALVSACGFKLRGDVELAPALHETYLQSGSPFSGIAPALRIELQTAGAQLTEDKKTATGILVVVGERSQRRVLSVGSSGKASEFELFEEVTFSLKDGEGNVLLKQQTVRMTRDLVFDENELLGKVAEAEQIQKQMRRNLARQILTRIEVGMRRQ